MDLKTSSNAESRISLGTFVILQDHRKNSFTVKVEKDAVEMLQGCNYGQAFTFKDKQWVKVNPNEFRGKISLDEFLQPNSDVESDEVQDSARSINRDNRHLIDDNTSQKLTHDEIVAIKQQVNTKDLITTIVNNSETFRDKTRISQEKYIARKEARHLKWFQVFPCDLFGVCESYYNSFPHKIGYDLTNLTLSSSYLNSASMGVMLFLANVRLNDKVIVFDHSLGLITGAIAQRLDGTGKIFRLVTKGVSDKIVHELGVGHFDNIASVDYEKIFKLDNVPSPSQATGKESSHELHLVVKRPKTETGLYPLAIVSKSEIENSNILIGNVSYNKLDKNNTAVTACTNKLKDIADAYLAPVFVLYGQQYQPMFECQRALSVSSNYVNVKLEEVFIREYQMEPQRTHPIMHANMRPFCGFIVSAIKIKS
ncbi:tRNA (adenine(58)-N(1))-methyltransferase non-catalytic subunit TRM6 [Babesia duncani]|uniref:tRNA (adenine(58)-N(1))-methyltransferase non-catalytic subunit TRM6 n=1 Tax=Babesia duncani TaxID=323732 RepID=A0AAD9PLT4_9APIC|nr:tRNA (adenine(58)-N(1))-methyltransferase non-catalytic subunit TRM6 [Babesia duncani]